MNEEKKTVEVTLRVKLLIITKSHFQIQVL